MADLREQLRRIEAAEPPDLWAGIEARAREGRPQVDANVGSVVAFRKQGSDRRRRVSAGLVAAAVFALMIVVAWEASRSERDRTAPDRHGPAGGLGAMHEQRARLLDRLPRGLVHDGRLRRRAGPGERAASGSLRSRSGRRATSCPRAGATRSRWRSGVRSTRSSSRRPIPRPPGPGAAGLVVEATVRCGSSTRR